MQAKGSGREQNYLIASNPNILHFLACTLLDLKLSCVYIGTSIDPLANKHAQSSYRNILSQYHSDIKIECVLVGEETSE